MKSGALPSLPKHCIGTFVCLAFEIKVTEYLTADIFRESDAADIGFACVCHADYALPIAFNPKAKMIRDKTLMEGHDCCNHRYIYG